MEHVSTKAYPGLNLSKKFTSCQLVSARIYQNHSMKTLWLNVIRWSFQLVRKQTLVELRALFVNASKVLLNSGVFSTIFWPKRQKHHVFRESKVAMPKNFSSLSVNFIEMCKNILSMQTKICRLSAKHLVNHRPGYASVVKCTLLLLLQLHHYCLFDNTFVSLVHCVQIK